MNTLIITMTNGDMFKVQFEGSLKQLRQYIKNDGDLLLFDSIILNVKNISSITETTE